MRQSDRDILETSTDIDDTGPVGERLRDDVLRAPHLEGNRKQRRAFSYNQRRAFESNQRRALAHNQRQKKKKFAQR